MLKSLNGTRLGGLMLIVGIAVVFLSGIFSPAVLIIDMVTGIEPANVEERLVAKVTNPDATNVTATFYLLGHVVLLGGLFALWPRGRRESRGDVMMRTGILAITVSIICGGHRTRRRTGELVATPGRLLSSDSLLSPARRAQSNSSGASGSATSARISFMR